MSIVSFTKETVVDGKQVLVDCLEVDGQVHIISRGPLRILGLEDDWYEDIPDPASVLAAVRSARVRADIFTFWQRLPDREPRFAFHTEWEHVAALPVTSFDHWWNRQIRPETRNLVRKAEKKGVEVRKARFDDDFVSGIAEIFNETPIRQGRRFWHYGKDIGTIRRQFSRCLFREDLLGAYYKDELIGFIMFGNAVRYGVLGQILSKVGHRDKSPTNALLAKAVEHCADKGLPYLVYAYWGDGPLNDFKRHNGFQEVRLPRYYVPLSVRGHLALRLGVHRGWKEMVPPIVRARLKFLRSRWRTRATMTSTPKNACQA